MAGNGKGGQNGGAMRIDPALVRELAELLNENGLTEIEVEDGDRKIKVARDPAPVFAAQAQAAPAQATAPLQPANDTQLISQIQRGLASLGFYHAPIDGKPGESTAKAIREFENFHSYRVTGQVNPDLVGLLRDAGATI